MHDISLFLFFRTFVIPCLFFIFDRLLKWCIFNNFAPKRSSCFLLQWLPLAQYKNTGIAFSLPLPPLLILFLSFIIIVFLFFLVLQGYRKQQGATQIFYLSLIFFGALSNFIDRARYSFVIDYIQLPWFWWIFNIADIMIIFGILGLLQQMFSRKKTGSSL